MKIHMEIPNGYQKYELTNWLKKYPDATDKAARNDAVKEWVQSKWGAWLARNEITDYSLYEVTPQYFRIDFTHDTDATDFATKCGAVILGE
ncbi:hypothetical protein [Rhizobium sp.]|uniref:hypothetical protein n=1 Tax=Rhizobium sp. TaxID=391 RepID=UPI0034C6051B